MKVIQLNPEIRWVLQLQTVFFGFLLIGALFFQNRMVFLSLLIGALIALIPSYLMAFWFFSYRGALLAKKMLGALYGVELIKWLLAVIGFSVLFGVFEGNLPAALLGFLVVQSVVWFLPLRGVLAKK